MLITYVIVLRIYNTKIPVFLRIPLLCCIHVIYLFAVIVRVRVVFGKTFVGDFNHLSGSHLQTPVNSRRQMTVFMPLVLVRIWFYVFKRQKPTTVFLKATITRTITPNK